MTVAALFIVMAVMLALGVPIAISLGLGTVAAILVDGNLPIALVAQRLFTSNDSVSLMAVPFFMLAGSIMTAGGISRRLVDFSNSLIGRVHGGLGMVATLTSMFFAAISGSNSATAAAVGGSLMPEMNKKGYEPEFSASVVAAASTTGIVIPPSVSMVLYGVSAGVSVGTLFIAGFVPGILMGLACMMVIYFQAKKRNYPREEKATFKQIVKTFLKSFWGLLTPIIIIGGIYGGIFTATEAAAAACVYALIVSIFGYRELSIKQLPAIIFDAVKSTAIVMFVMNAAGLFSWLITAYRVPQMTTEFFMQLTSNKYVMLLMINILLLIVGTFLNASSAVIILTPILMPVVTSMGINPVLFGIVMIVNLAIGTITPPVGVSLFVVQGISGLPFQVICKNVLPFLLALLVALIIITYIPGVSMLLPQLLGVL